MWFGTETGLSRFDGSNFKNYAAADGLHENEIINLFVDSKNRVWIFPFKNSVYFYFNGKIHNASNDSLIKKFKLNNEIFKVCEDKNGNIFFQEQKKIHILSTNDNLTDINEINGVSFYNDGCGTSSDGNCDIYLSLIRGAANHRVSIYEYKDSQFIAKDVLQNYNFSRSTLEVNSKYIIIRNRFFFEIYNRKANSNFKIKIPEHFHTLSYINDSCFAMSTYDKTYIYNINQERIIDSFLFNKVVNKCFKDNEDNLWFATMTQGVYRLSSTKFKVYKFEDLNSIPVYALSGFKGHLHIGGVKNLLWDLNLQNNKLQKSKFKN